ncbi:type II secretion system F family protein [Sphingomonas sp. ID0503]|uniref:type II secretion system F family protein n=1 Tax=Sphingomonas sp. ID0503 TaxID=3399691 RepID=UPI003AFB3163
MTVLPVMLFAFTIAVALLLAFWAIRSGGGAKRNRRLEAIRERHGSAESVIETKMNRVLAQRTNSGFDNVAHRLIPNPDLLRKRLAMTGSTKLTLGRYVIASGAIAVALTLLLTAEGLPFLLALLTGFAVGVGLPHMVVGAMVKRRIKKFTASFPDAIELLVRGLRSGLPISETMAVVAGEVPGPVGIEFRAVSDKMKIGRSMEAALQDTADRLGTPEFQFFVITLAIQRETGGNLAETLSNLADVLRKRGQMKLKIKAMSSEAKASAWIVGCLPFLVFGLIWMANANYLSGFMTDQRLMIAGGGGLVWLFLGVFVMSRMVSFEI